MISNIKNLATRALLKYKQIETEGPINAVHRAHRRLKGSEYREIDTILSAYHNLNGLKNPYQDYKLWSLRQLLNQHKPKNIIEFGCGSSTLIHNAYALNNNAKILSVEENQQWIENIKNILGPDSATIFQCCERLSFLDRIPPEIKYDFKTKENFDFAFIDGPDSNINGLKQKNAVNLNALEGSALPEIIVIDVRQATAEYMARTYDQFYDFYLSDLFSKKPLELGYRYFSVFTKKHV